MAGKRRSQAEARVERLPVSQRRVRQPQLAGWLPSFRSLAVGLALLTAGVGAYVAARETSLFAVERIEVEGASPQLADRVRRTLAPLVGSSLVSFDARDADRLLAAIPDIARADYDRDFPHTLRVAVRAERPVALLRQGSEAWLAAASGRALRRLDARPYPSLPRIWIARTVDLVPGERLTGPAAVALRAVAPLDRLRFPGRVRTVRASDGELTLVLASGLEVRLGDGGDLALKLAVAKRIIPRAGNARYVDVSVPERAVAGYRDVAAVDANLQVGGRG